MWTSHLVLFTLDVNSKNLWTSSPSSFVANWLLRIEPCIMEQLLFAHSDLVVSEIDFDIVFLC